MSSTLTPESNTTGSAFTTFTVLTTINGILTKEVSLDADGNATKTSTPNFSGGSHQTVAVGSLKDFLEVRCSLQPDQALMYSTPRNGNLSGIITTKKQRSGQQLSRSKDCFAHPSGKAILAIDYDARADSKPLTRQKLIKRFFEVIPAFRSTQVLWATSAGSCIYDTVTDKEHFGVLGQRLYIIVRNGSDIPRALHTLAQRLWLGGHGWIKVSKSGAMLKRTLIDLAMANAVQPDFAAGIVCHPPFIQRSQQMLIGKGDPLDTTVAIADLTKKELIRLDKIYKDAEKSAEAESRAARALWLENHVSRLMQHAEASGKSLTGSEIEEIRNNASAALVGGFLSGDFLITLENQTEVSVAEILENPTLYHEALCCDPLEPEYDNYRIVGMIFTANGSPCIHSYAHGKHTFQLIRHQNDIEVIGTTFQKVSRIHEGIAPHFGQTPYLTKQQSVAKLNRIFGKAS
jgi:hypothetical protein